MWDQPNKGYREPTPSREARSEDLVQKLGSALPRGRTVLVSNVMSVVNCLVHRGCPDSSLSSNRLPAEWVADRPLRHRRGSAGCVKISFSRTREQETLVF